MSNSWATVAMPIRAKLLEGYGPLGWEHRLATWPAILAIPMANGIREELQGLWESLEPAFAYKRTGLLITLEIVTSWMALPRSEWPTILEQLPRLATTAEEYLRSLTVLADSTDDLERVATSAGLGVLPLESTLVEGLWQAGRDGILRVEAATRFSRKPHVTLDVGPPEPPHGPVARFTVHGTNDTHTTLLTGLVESAVHALVSVIGHGYLAGGGTALVHLAHHLRARSEYAESFAIVGPALEGPLRQLALCSNIDPETIIPKLAGNPRWAFDIHAGRVAWPKRGPYDATALTVMMLNESFRTAHALIERIASDA